MKISLEELPHQQDALDAIIANFPELDLSTKDFDSFANPYIKGRFEEKNNIDIKMETGTGKTYVYTRLIYELHKKYGLFKFIIVVPSPAIKEGTRNFILSDYAKIHFNLLYPNTRIELATINSGDFSNRSGRKNFPAPLLTFTDSNRTNRHLIQVMLINAQMLNSRSMKNDDYNQTLLGAVTSPIEALEMTRPIVIIDEPHRFPRDKANYKAIDLIKPQLILRFGATFPEISEGKGKTKRTVKDYYRKAPQFELNAIDSFNDGLVKGIDIYYPNLTKEQASNRYIVHSVTPTQLILKQGQKEWEVQAGENLADVDVNFEGNIQYVGTSDKLLSNDLELKVGMSLIPGVFVATYQELIIQDAIEKHFTKEQENFLRENDRAENLPKIKTLTLFFIDSIKSYRDEDGWLKQTFEKLLKKKLKTLINEYELRRLPREIEYLDFLKVTLTSLNSNSQNVHAGYFGEDRGNGDEAIQAEVNDILKNKEKLLSFKDNKNEWETRRFLFSKWTLREGWDNPNVFVIAKLRTSGSEASKIQEVGRGLRLPVDETGQRISQDDFNSRLAFLIGYDEKDFANLLIGEINSESKLKLNDLKLDAEMIKAILKERNKTDPAFTENDLLTDLDSKGIINRSNEFKNNVEIDGVIKSGFEWLLELYPELTKDKLTEGRITSNKPNSNSGVKLRKENWNKFKDLWKEFSRRYMLKFERIPEQIQLIVESVLSDKTLFQLATPTSTQQSLILSEDGKEVLVTDRQAEYELDNYLPGLGYGQFVKQLVSRTNLAVKQVHPVLIKMLTETLENDSRFLSQVTLDNLVREFKQRFDRVFAQSYSYSALDFNGKTSVYSIANDDFIESITAERIGRLIEKSVVDDDRNLYEMPPIYFDSSDPELTLLKHNYSKSVTVFGKLPREAIKVPKYTGGTTTPDFVYLIENGQDSRILLFVETKAENMRESDKTILEIQKKFFGMLKQQGIAVEYTEATKPQDVYNKIKELIETK